MVKKMNPNKRRVSLELSKEVVKKVNLNLVETYGSSFGHFTRTVEAGLILWLEKQEGSTWGDFFNE